MDIFTRLCTRLYEIHDELNTPMSVVFINDLEWEEASKYIHPLGRPDKALEKKGFRNFLCQRVPVLPDHTVRTGNMRVGDRNDLKESA